MSKQTLLSFSALSLVIAAACGPESDVGSPEGSVLAEVTLDVDPMTGEFVNTHVSEGLRPSALVGSQFTVVLKTCNGGATCPAGCISGSAVRTIRAVVALNNGVSFQTVRIGDATDLNLAGNTIRANYQVTDSNGVTAGGSMFQRDAPGSGTATTLASCPDTNNCDPLAGPNAHTVLHSDDAQTQGMSINTQGGVVTDCTHPIRLQFKICDAAGVNGSTSGTNPPNINSGNQNVAPTTACP
ncbi:MAG: hypothetical protein HY791_22845 [Deltaproteobacteria bacterium]|nr:hypothetical protein [Deltaproteobacteria bacterium]